MQPGQRILLLAQLTISLQGFLSDNRRGRCQILQLNSRTLKIGRWSAASSAQDWADTAVKNRARIAKDEIIASLVVHCNANEIALAVGEDAQVAQAFDLGVVKTAAQRTKDAAQ